MPPKAPSVYHCPCCGSTFVYRRLQQCPACAIPLHLQGEYMVAPCYLYSANKWFWFESGEMKPWEDGWKRPPKPDAKGRDTRWLDKYPGRPTGL
jgi:hypothetical protein